MLASRASRQQSRDWTLGVRRSQPQLIFGAQSRRADLILDCVKYDQRCCGGVFEIIKELLQFTLASCGQHPENSQWMMSCTAHSSSASSTSRYRTSARQR